MIIKHLLTSCLLLCLFAACESLNSERSRYDLPLLPPSKIQNLIEKYWRVIYADEAKAFELAQKALQLAQLQNSQLGLHGAYLCLGNYYMKKQSPKKAFELYQKALILSQNLHPQSEALSLMELGEAYSELSDSRLAILYFSKAEKIALSLNDKWFVAKLATNLAALYYKNADYEEALKETHKALFLFQEISNQISIGDSYRQAAMIHLLQNNDDSALFFYDKSNKIFFKNQNKEGLINNLYDLGRLYHSKQKATKALTYFDKALEISQEIGKQNEKIALKTTIEKGFVLLHLNQIEAVQNICNEADKNKIVQNAPEIKAELDILKSALLAKNGKHAEAYQLAQEAYQAKLAWQIQRDALKFQNLNIIQEVEQQKQENELLKQQNEYQTQVFFNYVIALFSVTLLAGFVFLAIAYRNRIKYQKHIIERNQYIEAQKEHLDIKNKELTKLNHELDSFVYQISHNFRSPLTAALGLLALIKQEENPDTKQYYLDLQQSSLERLDNLIYNVYDYFNNARNPLNIEKIDFEQLLGEVFKTLKMNPQQVQSIINITHEIYSDRYRVGVILRNLLSNALKFKKTSQEDASITLTLQTHPSHFSITVADEGIGIAQQYQEKIFDLFFCATNEQHGSGIGLYIVRETVLLLGGEIHLHTEVNLGTRFEIELPYLSDTETSTAS